MFDGSCGPKNPGGTAAFGFTLKLSDKSLNISGHGIIGTGPGMTNNLAEYYALCEGFLCLLDQDTTANDILQVKGDAKFVIDGMNYNWKGNSLKPYHPQMIRARKLLRQIHKKNIRVSFDWVAREQNQECDDLSKKG